MRCKHGDLAIVIKSIAGNEGKIVRCLKFRQDAGTYDSSGEIHMGVWVTDSNSLGWDGKFGNFFHDSQLLPIRDNPGTDETIQWAGKPNEVMM